VRLFNSELLKLRTTPRTVLGLLLAFLAIVLIGTVGTITGADPVQQTTLEDVESVVEFGDVIALILGVLVMTWEYRHDTITETFLVEPRRERVVAAKAVAAMATGGLLAATALALSLAIAYVWIGDEVSFDGGIWGTGGRLVASAAIYGALGVGLGAIVRGQALAIVLVFVWFLIAEPLVQGLYDEVGRYLPGSVLTQLAGESGNDAHLSTGPAVGMAILYLVAFVGVGAFLTVRRDVT
jgi:ABC-2 type transport system permease protein